MKKIALIALFCYVRLENVCTQKMVESAYIRDFGQCDVKGTLFHFARVYVNLTGKGTTTFNGIIDVDEDLEKITMLSLKVDRCTSYDDRDSGGCEYYTTLKYQNPCAQVIVAKNMPWSPLFTTKPPLTCPIKKGAYSLHDALIKPGDIRAPPGLYWRFQMKMYVGNKVISCMKGGVERMATRMRTKSKGS